MQVKYGTFPLDANSCDVRASFQTEIAGGLPIKVRRRLDVDGYLNGDGQAAIAQAASALATALAVPYQDLVLYRDDGTASDTALLNAGSLTGVVVRGLEFPDSRGGEYATFRHFRFYGEAEYPVANTLNLLLSFRETVSFSGGGPISTWKLAINGQHQRQVLYPSSIYRATQKGSAVGFRQRPTAPPPLWPSALIEPPDFDLESPERSGKLYTGFGISWQYVFGSNQPLIGEPTLWR